jgi:glycosyltransferase involved in cell wall biosynthesis
MRIVIDASSLLMRSAGVKTYVYGWLRALLTHAAPGEIAAFPFVKTVAGLNHEKSLVDRAGTRNRLRLLGLINLSPNPLLDLLLCRHDLFHASQHIVNPPHSITLTATVFDMTCWLVPEMHTPENVAATKRHAARVLRRADKLIAISECTRNDAMQILNLPKERLEVIYPGVDDRYYKIPPEDVAVAKGTYGLTRPYFLYVGCIEPRKNVKGILDAYRMLHPSLRKDVGLVLAGPLGWQIAELKEQLRQDATELGVRLLGYVPERILPGLLKGASALLYPSFYEGFGLPAAQAMAAGVPVITSNVSCLPEVTGGGALLVDPRRTGEIAEAMRQIILSTSLRERLQAAGHLRAAQFRWDRCAAETLRVFRNLQR